jgi:hypothetical protein
VVGRLGGEKRCESANSIACSRSAHFLACDRLLLTGARAVGQGDSKALPTQNQKDKSSSAADSSSYVGAETGKTCHEDISGGTGPAIVDLANTSHYGYFDVLLRLRLRPYKRLAVRLGANLTATSGTALLIAPTAPSGPLDSRYYQCFGGVDYGFNKNWTGKAYWGITATAKTGFLQTRTSSRRAISVAT